LIFPVGNPKKLAEQMRFAIENPKQMAEFGAAAREEAKERFDIEKIAKEYEGVLCVIARGDVIARK
jgi:glycosyltransferase involved in cell wall biosynthesis